MNHPPLAMVHHATVVPSPSCLTGGRFGGEAAGVRGRGGRCAGGRPGPVERNGAAGIAADLEERPAAATWELGETGGGWRLGGW